MKNATKHFLERWVERIVGVTTEKERNDYINSNRQMLIEHANKTFEHAEFIYTGVIGNNTVKNYYIEDDIIFVTNTTNDALITVYRIDLGYTSDINAYVRRNLLVEIQRLTAEHEEIELEAMVEVDKKNEEAELLDDQIKVMQEQLRLMERQRDFLKQEAKNLKSKSLNTGLELKKFTMMLVNSKEYKDDLRSIG
jgi:hypothetical protein